jgi:hypothetical protein
LHYESPQSVVSAPFIAGRALFGANRNVLEHDFHVSTRLKEAHFTNYIISGFTSFCSAGNQYEEWVLDNLSIFRKGHFRSPFAREVALQIGLGLCTICSALVPRPAV